MGCSMHGKYIWQQLKNSSFRLMDHAPSWLVARIVRLLNARPDHELSRDAGLSRILQYWIDQKLSGAPWLKIVFLVCITFLCLKDQVSCLSAPDTFRASSRSSSPSLGH